MKPGWSGGVLILAYTWAAATSPNDSPPLSSAEQEYQQKLKKLPPFPRFNIQLLLHPRSPVTQELLSGDANHWQQGLADFRKLQPYGQERVRNELRTALMDSHWELRKQALAMLFQTAPASADAVPDLRDRLAKDEHEAVRADAARGLGLLGASATDGLPELTERLLVDDSPVVRARAAEALGLIGSLDEPAAMALAGAAAWEDPQVSIMAKGALLKLHIDMTAPMMQALSDKAAAARLVRQLSDPKEEVRNKARERIKRMGYLAAPALMTGLEDKNLKVASEAAMLLGRIGPAAKQAIPALTKAAKEPRWTKNVCRALEEIGGPAAIPALADVLEHGQDPLVQVDAIDALARLSVVSPQDVFPRMAAALGSSDPGFRRHAAMVLSKTGTPPLSVLPAVIQALGDATPEVQGIAADIIAHIGLQAKEAVPRLIGLLQDSGRDDDLRASAAHALFMIHTPEALEAVRKYDEEDVYERRTAPTLESFLKKRKLLREEGSRYGGGPSGSPMFRSTDLTPVFLGTPKP